MDETEKPENQPGEAPGEPSAAGSRVSTPVLVGSMAAGILAVAFIVAIVRGGGEAPSTGSASPASGRPAARSGEAGGKAGRPQGDITLVAPIGMASKDGLSFQWTPVEAAQDYEVTIYDPLMKQVWNSPRVAGDSVEPPERILEFLKVGTPYNWKVTGYTPRGSAIKSVTHTFRLAGSSVEP